MVEANGLRFRVALSGQGPLVVLVHGWPESWYSWRHQMSALAEAGYQVAAPDVRGYGGSDKPEAVEAYAIKEMCADIAGLVSALGADRAILIGHDWGAPIVWNTSLFHPEKVRAVAGLSVPHLGRGPMPRIQLFRQLYKGRFFYQLYFQEPGVAEAELGRDPRETLRRVLWGGSGDARREALAPGSGEVGMVRRDVGFLGRQAVPATLPPWLTEADLDFYAGEFARVGFRGGLNWYRNIDRNWELLAPWAGARVTVPALYITGDRDLVRAFRGMDQLLPALKQLVPELRQTIVLQGCGHWTQQERPTEVNTAMRAFLETL